MRPYLSVRGRNIYFATRIGEALQLDKLENTQDLKKYKAAFTAEAVRDIHEAVMETWPPNTDIVETLSKTTDDVTGLYIGDYTPEYLGKAIVRHSIYTNKLLLIDPFIYPRSVRDEYNPIVNPEQYRAQTLKNVNLYFSLMPWIKAGIIEVIRTPADFDRKLNWESMISQEKKIEGNEELKKALELSVSEMMKRHGDNQSMRLSILAQPDFKLRELFSETYCGKEEITEDQFIDYVNKLRNKDPNFLESIGPNSKSGQIHIFTSGAGYNIAKLTANLTGSHLVTDLPLKWREIELDRENADPISAAWSPFAKAMQNAPLKYLNAIDLKHAFILRKEGRLERFRTFLHSVWGQASTGEPFDEANAVLLANQLIEEIYNAEEEWKRIDRDLLKIVGAEATAGLLAAGPLIGSGHGGFLAAAGVVAGSSALISSTMRHRSFKERFPAAFFLSLNKEG